MLKLKKTRSVEKASKIAWNKTTIYFSLCNGNGAYFWKMLEQSSQSALVN